MDYIDQLKQFAERAEQIAPNITTEEATKTALILPFFQMLGYDVFNPLEFVPEYTADVGIKKGEKVDYAILLDNKPAILIEAKWCGEKLDSHSSQLFRYFGTTEAKFGILTNGLVYRFYTDLDEPNKMDLVPFMEFNLLDIRDNLIAELKRFKKDNLDLENVFNAASELKYTTAIKAFIAEQVNNPSDEFVNFALGNVYSGKKTRAIIEKFKPIVKRSFSLYLNDTLSDKFKSMMNANNEQQENHVEDSNETTEDTLDPETPLIQTTAEEIEAYITIKAILHETIPASRLFYKDTQNYFGILVDNKVNHWICRLYMEGKKKSVLIHTSDESKNERISITCANDLFALRDKLIAATNLQM